MYRRNFIQKSLFAFAAVSLGKNPLQNSTFADPWNIKMLTDNLGIFTESGGTILFHYSGDGITVVDAQFPQSANHLIEELKKRKAAPFHLLINTHHHADHTAGNIAFQNVLKRVLAHENSLANQKKVAVAQNKEAGQFYPNQTFGKVWQEKAGNENITLHYFGAGHTNGDAIIHFKKANVVHMGDLVFNRRHPFVDRSAGANIESWITVLRDTLRKFDSKTVFVCGHSGSGYEVTGNKQMLVDFSDYLRNVLVYVKNQIDAGKSKEEILRTTEIPGSPQWKGDGIERPLTAAYEELTA